MKPNSHTPCRRRAISFLFLWVMIGMAASLMAAERRSMGYLGVSVERLSHQEKKEMGISFGVVVTDVVKNSPAEKAGIEEEDIIQFFDGKKIRTPQNLVDAVRDTEPKSEVKVTLLRDKEKMELPAAVGKYRNRAVWMTGSRANFLGFGAGPYLGVKLQEMNADLAPYFGTKEDEGVLVLEVSEDTPAEEAGVKAGDVIVQIDGEEVGTPEDIRAILSDFEEGGEVEITLYRQRIQQKMKVTLDETRNLDFHYHLPDFEDGKFENFYMAPLDHIDEKTQLKMEKEIQSRVNDARKNAEETSRRIKDMGKKLREVKEISVKEINWI